MCDDTLKVSKSVETFQNLVRSHFLNMDHVLPPPPSAPPYLYNVWIKASNIELYKFR